MTDMVRIGISADSGPYASYWRAADTAQLSVSVSRSVIEVPKELWDRYEAARKIMDAAEQEIDQIERAQS